MEILAVIDQKDYDPNLTYFRRKAARGIIFKDGKLLMIKSDMYGEYKFPGGGILKYEPPIDGLKRELLEETGMRIIYSTIKEFGKTLELRQSQHGQRIFRQESYYYTCQIDTTKPVVATVQPTYEQDYGHLPVFTTVEQAIAANEKCLDLPHLSWMPRELAVLKKLL